MKKLGILFLAHIARPFHIATVLLSSLFIDGLAVGCPQAVLPLQLNSAFYYFSSTCLAINKKN